MIVPLRGRFWILGKNESGQQFQRNVIWHFAECMTPYNDRTQWGGESQKESINQNCNFQRD